MEPHSGELLARRYKLLSQIGVTRFGPVWRALHIEIAREVAIRFLHGFASTTARQRFVAEARALGNLTDPHCLKLFDHGVDEHGRRWVATELVEAPTLTQWVTANPPVAERFRVATQICTALAAAHAIGILHRNLTPANVLVRPTPDGPSALVYDFGLAKLTGEEAQDVTKTGEVVGSPGFMSPEQLRAADVGPPSDVYALGALLFELFEGRPVFTADSSFDVAMMHVNEPPPPMAPLPPYPHVPTLIASMLAKSPGDRPPNGKAALEGLLSPAEPGDTTLPTAEPPTLERAAATAHERREVPVTAIAVTAALVVGFAAGVAMMGSDDATPRAPVRSAPAGATLIRETTPPGVAAASRDAADVAQQPTGDDLGIGCRRTHPGTGAIELIEGMEGLWAYIPKSYRTDAHSAAIVVFHDAGQMPSQLVSDRTLTGLAERFERVILAPGDNLLMDVWYPGADMPRVERQLDFVRDELCVDLAGAVSIGLGNGGTVAELLASSLPGGVLVTWAWRPQSTSSVGTTRPPHLFMVPLGDPFAPVDGKLDCIGQRQLTLEELYELLSAGNGCTGAVRRRQSCVVRNCETPLWTCELAGGRFWPGLEPPTTVCAMSPVRFDFEAKIAEFVEATVAPRLRPHPARDVERVR